LFTRSTNTPGDPISKATVTELPTRTGIFVSVRDALNNASTALSEARDWMRSDWSPVGSSLTTEAAKARITVLQDQMRQGLVARNVAALVTRIPSDAKDSQTLTATEEEKALTHIEGLEWKTMVWITRRRG
jgi:hypothetical protein